MTIDPEGIDWFRDPRLIADPYPYFNALRDKCPVQPEDHYGVTMVTGWEEAVAVYNDETTFSSCIVKNALNILSACSGAIPVPEFWTLITTQPSRCSERTQSMSGRSVTEAKESTAFVNRFKSTCCSCTRSAWTAERSSRSCSASETRRLFSSPSEVESTSQTSSFTATGELSPESFLNIARMPVMMCAARRPSLTTRSNAKRASSRFGSGRSNQRRPALPFDTIAASGWLSSCAIVPAIAPTVVSRATLPSSD